LSIFAESEDIERASLTFVRYDSSTGASNSNPVSRSANVSSYGAHVIFLIPSNV
jgi:hypothetical protein